jgi:hypothetical protein
MSLVLVDVGPRARANEVFAVVSVDASGDVSHGPFAIAPGSQ